MKYGFGVDLGGTAVKLGFFDAEGALLEKWEIPTVTQNNGAQILPDIAAAIDGYVQEKKLDHSSLLGIGIGVPGPVLADGTVNGCVNLGWGVFNIEQQLSNLTDLPVRAGNDASLAMLGEAWKGVGRNYDSMVLITLGTGVGGGVLVDGKVVNGAKGAAGEIGHIILNPMEQEPFAGGQGSAEQYCSATGILRQAKAFLKAYAGSSCLQSISELSCKDVFDAAAAGDTAAQQILENVYARLGQLIALVCCMTDPALVALGGGVSKAGEPLLDGARRHFRRQAFHAHADTPIALAQLGNDAGIYGAFRHLIT